MAWRGGGALWSGGPLVILKENGVPEAGRGMGVAMVRLSRRQASWSSVRVSVAGRAATHPQTTTLSVGVDMVRVRQ